MTSYGLCDRLCDSTYSYSVQYTDAIPFQVRDNGRQGAGSGLDYRRCPGRAVEYGHLVKPTSAFSPSKFESVLNFPHLSPIQTFLEQ